MRPPKSHRSPAFILGSALAYALMPGCGSTEGARIPLVEGNAPELVSWSGSTECCGEDPHPVHGALLDDGSVVMVGKSIGSGDSTRGFATRWLVPQELSAPELIDQSGEIVANLQLSNESSLLQVVQAGEFVVAVGFEASSLGGTAKGVALLLDAETLEERSRIVVSAPDDSDSTTLESVFLSETGSLLLGGAWGFPRSAMEGFKSYGNVVGGRGLLVELDLDDWLASESSVLQLADIPHRSIELEGVYSLKSIVEWPDGRVAAVAANEEEASGLVWIDAERNAHDWSALAEGVELTDLSIFALPEGKNTLALSGHGGEGVIDAWAFLVSETGELIWQRSFGNPLVVPSESVDAQAIDAYIFDECWGIAQFGEELVLACGTGIEGCDAIEASNSEQRDCRNDPRLIWRSYMVALDAEGDVSWSRAESFVDGGEAAESAAEFVFSDGDRLFGVIDQGFGVGLTHYR